MKGSGTGEASLSALGRKALIRTLLAELEAAVNLEHPKDAQMAVSVVQQRCLAELAVGEEVCRYLPQDLRMALWGRPIPEGTRLGWRCQVAYCGNPDHYALEADRTFGHRDYREIRQRLRGLAVGEWFDLPDEATDEKSRLKFRVGLGAGFGPRFMVRTLKTGGLRIIRGGDWLL